MQLTRRYESRKMRAFRLPFHPLTVELIYLATSTECTKPINQLATVKGFDWMKNENDEKDDITIF